MERLIWEHREEAELVALAQLGNLSAFDALVARYRPGALVLAKQITRPADAAEDAVQDSFLAVFKALPQLSDPEKFAAWFGAILRHRARRASLGDRSVHLAIDDVILFHTPALSDELEQRAGASAVHSALCELPEEIRAIFELYYLEDWGAGKISEFLGLPITTVKWRLHAGRKLLRSSLSFLLEESNESGK